MSPSARGTRRPGGVTFLVVLSVLQGLGGLIGGIFLAATHNRADVIRDTKTNSHTLLVYGISAIAIGLIYLLVARGLAHGNGLARFLVGLVSLVDVIGGVAVAVTKHGDVRTQAIGSAVVGFVILVLLYSPKANAFFRGR